jgi:hypothetical protein
MDAGGKASICRFTIHKVKIGDFSFSGFGILSDFFILEIISISANTSFLILAVAFTSPRRALLRRSFG